MATNHRVINADALTALRAMPDNSVDSIVTDPPYGLADLKPDLIAGVVGAWLSGDREAAPSGRGFMGKTWDAFIPPPAIFDECFRVLKPGGHLLAFAGSRTVDLMGLSIRLAGFEVRDQMQWLYGSGFPKSLDVSKAIDKTRSEDVAPLRVVCRAIRAAMDAQGLKSRDLVHLFGNCNPRLVDHWAARDTDSQPSLPTPAQWAVLRDALSIADPALNAEVARLNARKGERGEAWKSADVVGTGRGVDTTTSRLGFAGATYGGDSASHEYDLKAPNSVGAAAWQGWGTALKPAHEPIVVARKPLAGTVAANVLTHGTGALNIDASRIAHRDEADLAASLAKNPGRTDAVTSDAYGADRPQQRVNREGRFPTNVILDEEAADTLGDAARYFYAAKAPKSERPVVDGVAHPTVKPLALMRYLVRLVTPPAGVVLDPFAGSGTTAEAALLEGFDSVAVELGAEYVPLITARLQRSGASATGNLSARTPETSAFIVERPTA